MLARICKPCPTRWRGFAIGAFDEFPNFLKTKKHPLFIK